MSVLSDTEIAARIRNDGLIQGGDPARATECSYSFVSGSAFIPGETAGAIAFPGPNGNAEVTVRPGQMIWIRTHERVKIPTDLVGFWWQTNSLSRKGLMLVNMSMVEPGYEGDLACLFVNFAKSTIVISPTTAIAKMVFMTLQGAVQTPFTGAVSRSRYDDALRQLAIDQPKSFLQIAELSTELGNAKATAIADIQRGAAESRALAQTEIAGIKESAVSEFKKDIPSAVRNSFGIALAAFAVLSLVSVGVDYAKGRLFPDVKDIARSEAEAVLRERVTVQGMTNSNEIQLMIDKLSKIDARVGNLEKKP